MKPTLLHLLGAIALLATMPSASALVTTHGREPVHCSGWSEKLSAILNDPARVSGKIGPLGPSAQFQFAGDKDTFNAILAQYATLDQQPRVLYISANAALSSEGPDFEVSITRAGHGFLYLHMPGRIALADLKIPKGVDVEASPPVVLPVDPELRGKVEAEQKRIDTFVAAHKKAAGAARTLQPGAMAPGIQALAADGNPVPSVPGQKLPDAMANMHVLVVFWSLKDPGDAGLVAQVAALHREFRKGRFQIASICIDDDFEAWGASLAAPGRINDRICWQLTQAGSGADCAATFGVAKTPSAFLIQPNGRFFATHIPPEKLRETIAKALDWDSP
jgi:hypothetical protein